MHLRSKILLIYTTFVYDVSNGQVTAESFDANEIKVTKFDLSKYSKVMPQLEDEQSRDDLLSKKVQSARHVI